MNRHLFALALAAPALLAVRGPAQALDALQSTTVPGRAAPLCASPATAGGLALNRADGTLTVCDPAGAPGIFTLLKALPSGRRAVEQGQSDDQTVAGVPLSSVIKRSGGRITLAPDAIETAGPITCVTGSACDVSGLSVSLPSLGLARSLAARAADQAPSIKEFGQPSGNDWTAVVTAAEASAAQQIYLPPGRYPTTLTHYQATNKTYLGPGRLVVGANSSGVGGVAAAPFRSFITAPRPDVPDDRTLSFGLNDWSKSLPNGVAYTFVGPKATGTTPASTYKNFPQLSQTFRVYDYTAGFNADPGDHAKGRSGAFMDAARIYHGGQGDLVGRTLNMEVYSALPGATHWLANPAIVAHNGGFGASGSATGAYLNESEHIYRDNGLSVAVVDRVRNYNRTNQKKTVDQVWVHDRPQSVGSKPIDVFYAPQGLGRTVFDATGVQSADGAAVVLRGGQRVYYNASPAVDSLGANFGAGSLGDVWTVYDPNTKTLRVNVGAGGALVIDNLPTSTTGLPSGGVYKDANGFLKVAP